MRDPARIDRMVNLLRAYWHAHPDLRLGQIVGNFTPRVRKVSIATIAGVPVEYADVGPGDSYNVEDDVIEAALQQAAKKIGGE